MAKKQIVKIILVLGLFLTLQKCASQLPPPGGKVDKIPPTVIETYPVNGTTNFKDSYVEITFSEYVNKRDIRNAIFISPIIEGALEFSWTNKTVEITFPDTLLKNTTYSIIVGTEVTDVNNHNPMDSPYILTFSTGNKIDSGKIAGSVYDKKTDGTLIFAYKNRSDTLNIYKDKPDYISQVGKNGKYEFNGLGLGNYRIFAITDEFKNYVYNIGEDRIGIQSNEIKIKKSSDVIKKQNFFLMKEDTLEPNIQKVTMTDVNHLTVEFNEPVDSSKLLPSNFSIYDSTDNLKHKIKFLFKAKNKNQYVLCLKDSLKIDNKNYLNAKNIFDKHKNYLQYESISFTASDKPDTTAPVITNIVTKYKSNTIDFLDPHFDIIFSDAIDSTKAKKGINFFTNDSLNIFTKINFLDDASLRVTPLEKLTPKKKYFVTINLNQVIDIAGNKTDTTVRKRILTISKLDFTGAMGKVIGNKNKNVKLVLESLGRNGSSIQTNLNVHSEFNFSRVIPGNYLLCAYDDKDSNNVYSYGSIKPYKYSEKFIFYQDTLKLKARWPIGDILIDFD